jgi:hypothetical protein
MRADTLRIDLIDKIVHADDSQVEEIYGWIANYFNKKEPDEEWETLPELHQKLVMQGVKEANAGLCIPFDEATQKLRDKYGLNG